MPNGKLPKEAQGLQLNFCKTLACDNFGLSDAEKYVLQHVNPKRPAMVCRECGAFPPLLNNQSVLDELQRLKQTQTDGLPACKNTSCESLGLSVHSHKHLYHSFGYSGQKQRYRCKACQSTFVDQWSESNHKLQIQESILGYLFTGHPVREICRRLSINPKTFYDHLNQIAKRCRRKLSVIDERWFKHADNYTLASQFVPLQPNSHNGVFWIASGEVESGYIVAQHTNYSEEELKESQDNFTTARIVSTSYTPEAQLPFEDTQADIRTRIDNKYQLILARDNVEDPLGNLAKLDYPLKGTLIHPHYTSYAHYLYLEQQLETDRPISIFMPQDPLLRSAALSVYLPRIKAESIDIVYVEESEGWQNSTPVDKHDIVHMGWWRDRWAITQQNTIESDQRVELMIEKAICVLAGKQQPSHWLQSASTRSISSYQRRFQVIFNDFVNEPRRRLRPAGINPLLDIFRAWHNLCYQDKSGLTAAQKLKLIDKTWTLKELLS
ncbi:IS1 family transposase [Vibrio maerlii]|uniref:IS1 family transposase n=1 Tax=Vibrio maerlii TaxID=2231648 RepID=UPI000E3E6BC0|nr:IS1 family transposase [Vibrio maerlii]